MAHGEFFGTKQHGIPEFKIANLFTDIEMLKQVQSIVMEILSKDPDLEKDENKILQKMIEDKFKDRIEIWVNFTNHKKWCMIK